MEPTRQETKAPPAHFSLWDTVCLIVGCIVGAGIFATPGTVFAVSGGPLVALAIWVAGGVLAIVGAFCFAELASTYPRSGGEYVYLSRAFGSWAGFLFAWGQLLFIRTGASMVAVAYVFANYAMRLANADNLYLYTGLALASVILLTLTNIIGVRAGKWTQNTLTVVKVLGLAGVLFTGLWWAQSDAPQRQYLVQEGRVLKADRNSLVLSTSAASNNVLNITIPDGTKVTVDGRERKTKDEKYKPTDVEGMYVKVLTLPENPGEVLRVKATSQTTFGAISVALILVLWTYSGWHEGGYIAAEVRNRRRNLPLALLLATGTVIVIYLSINTAYWQGLGYEDAADAKEVAADVLSLMPWTVGESSRNVGEIAICVLIMVSCLGSINGCIYTSSRIFAEFGTDHGLFAPLGRWHGNLGTPVIALLVQCAVSIITIVLVACFFPSRDSFDAVLKGTAPVFWLFFFLTGLALFVLRRLDRGIERPFTAPLYPLTPLVYCASCGFMLFSSVQSAFEEKLSGWFVVVTILAVLTGVPLYFLSRHKGRQRATVLPADDRPVHVAAGD